jgi:WD40 repeat protein/uncharacterized caspase-like protein
VKFFAVLTILLLTQTVISQTPRLIVPDGHPQGANLADYSPDGKYVVTASTDQTDRTARVWEVASGKMLYSLSGHTFPLQKVAFSKNGKYILTHNFNLHIWNAATGEKINTIADSTSVLDACFLPDGDGVLITAYDKNEIAIIDIDKNTFTKKINTGNTRYSHINISGNGEYILAFANANGKAADSSLGSIFSTETGEAINNVTLIKQKAAVTTFSPNNEWAALSTEEELVVFKLASDATIYVNKQHNYAPPNITFSYHSKYLFAAMSDNVLVLETKTGTIKQKLKLNEGLAALKRVDGTIGLLGVDYKYGLYIFDSDSLKIVYHAQLGNTRTNNLIVSPERSTFLVTTFSNHSSIFNIKDFSYRSHLASYNTDVKEINISANEKKMVTTGFSRYMKTLDPITVNGVTLFYDSSRIEKAYFSPSGQYIFTTSSTNGTMWDEETKKRLYTIKTTTIPFQQVVFNPVKNSFCVFEPLIRKISVREIQTGKLLFAFNLDKKRVNGESIAYSPDGEWILFNSALNIEVRNSINGKLSKTLIKASKTNTKKNIIKKITVSPSGAIVAAISDSLLLAWQFKTGAKIFERYWTDNTKEDALVSIQFNNDETHLVVAHNNGTVTNFDIHSDSTEMIARDFYPSTLLDAQFTDNDKKILSIGGLFGYMVQRDAKTGELINVMGNQTDEITGYTFINNKKNIITASNSTLKKYDVKTGKLQYQTILIGETDWLTTDTAGRFDGTEGARKLLYFTCGKEIIELEQVKDLLWVPGLANRINNGDTIQSKKITDIELCGLTPLVIVGKEDAENYHYTIEPRSGGLGQVVLQVNGIEVKRYKKEQLVKEKELYYLTISKKEISPYFAGGFENKIGVKALTYDNTISSRNVIIDEDSIQTNLKRPNFYAVIVGVSDYKGDEMDLKYAAKDAIDFSTVMKKAASRLLNTDTTNHVFIYNFSSQKNNITPEKNNIKKAFAEISIKAEANDILLVFFAGHGIMQGEQKQFYFLTGDASKATVVDNINEVGISTAELTEWIKPENIKAQKRILIFDACNSGQAIKDMVRIGEEGQQFMVARNDDKAQQIKAIDKLSEKSGLFILAASASNQSAYEMSKFSQGVLTYSLLKTLKEQPAVLNNNRYIDLARWFNAAKETVEEISRSNDARQEPQVISNTNFIVGVADEEVLSSIILPLEKPIFESAIFLNASSFIADDDIELTKQLNKEMAEVAVRNINSSIIYTPAATTKDAYTLTGKYTLTAQQLIVTVNVKKDKRILHQFQITGVKNKLEELSREIIARAVQLISQTKK